MGAVVDGTDVGLSEGSAEGANDGFVVGLGVLTIQAAAP